MSEPVEFPVPADDLRFLKRLERSRSPPLPPPQSRDPPARTKASVEAEWTLRKYMRPLSCSRRPDTLPWSPNRMVAVMCVMFAGALIPLELIYLLMCRPDLRGRRVRARLITPRDVLRSVFIRSLPVRTLLNRFRI